MTSDNGRGCYKVRNRKRLFNDWTRVRLDNAIRKGGKGMKVTDIRSVRAGNYLFVYVDTDSGITGIGEAGAWSFLNAAGSAIEKLREFVVGQDPFAIEHLWQAMYRTYYFRGAVITSAISAIDIALWDIKGKALGVPVYELLGGKYRDRARVYAPVFEFTADRMAQGCRLLKDQGFTAARLMVGDGTQEDRSPLRNGVHSLKVAEAVARVRECRAAVGKDFDLCVEVHRSMNPAEAIAFMEEIAPYHPLFVEDPIPPDNPDAMANLGSRTSVPIATGERFTSMHEFQLLLARHGAQYVRPDLCLAGGITAAKKIAAIAEVNYVGVVPHNPLGPVSTAACLQLDASIPNFTIQEYPSYYDAEHECTMLVEPFSIEEGSIMIPDRPGIGIELVDDLPQRFPPANSRREFSVQRSFDGAVRDF